MASTPQLRSLALEAKSTDLRVLDTPTDRYLTELEHHAIHEIFTFIVRIRNMRDIARNYLNDSRIKNLELSYAWLNIASQQLKEEQATISAQESEEKKALQEISGYPEKSIKIKAELEKLASKTDQASSDKRTQLTTEFGQLLDHEKKAKIISENIANYQERLSELAIEAKLVVQDFARLDLSLVFKGLGTGARTVKDVFESAHLAEMQPKSSYEVIKAGYIKASHLGHKEAFYRLGHAAEARGHIGEALGFYRMAAAQNNPIACLRLSRYYKAVIAQPESSSTSTINEAKFSQNYWLKEFAKRYNQDACNKQDLLEGAQGIKEIPGYESFAEMLLEQVAGEFPQVAYELLDFWNQKGLLEDRLRKARYWQAKAINDEVESKLIKVSPLKEQALAALADVESKVARAMTTEQLRRDILRAELDRHLIGGGLGSVNPKIDYHNSLSLRLMFWVNAWGVLGSGTLKTEAERPEEIAKESMNMIFGFIPIVGSKLATASDVLWGTYNKVNNRDIWNTIGRFFKDLREQGGWGTNERIIGYLVQQMTLARRPSELEGAPSFKGELRDKLGYGIANRAQEEGMLDMIELMKVLWQLPKISDLTPYVFGNKSLNKNGLDILLEKIFHARRMLFPRPLPEVVQFNYQRELVKQSARLEVAEDKFVHSELAKAHAEIAELKATQQVMQKEIQSMRLEVKADQASMKDELEMMRSERAQMKADRANLLEMMRLERQQMMAERETLRAAPVQLSTERKEVAVDTTTVAINPQPKSAAPKGLPAPHLFSHSSASIPTSGGESVVKKAEDQKAETKKSEPKKVVML